MTGGPAELEGVAAGWGKATDCSEGAAELAVCRTSLEGLDTTLVKVTLLWSGQLSPDPFGSLPGNDGSVRDFVLILHGLPPAKRSVQREAIFENEHFYMVSRPYPRFDFESLDFGAKAGWIRYYILLRFVKWNSSSFLLRGSGVRYGNPLCGMSAGAKSAITSFSGFHPHPKQLWTKNVTRM